MLLEKTQPCNPPPAHLCPCERVCHQSDVHAEVAEGRPQCRRDLLVQVVLHRLALQHLLQGVRHGDGRCEAGASFSKQVSQVLLFPLREEENLELHGRCWAGVFFHKRMAGLQILLLETWPRLQVLSTSIFFTGSRCEAGELFLSLYCERESFKLSQPPFFQPSLLDTSTLMHF